MNQRPAPASVAGTPAGFASVTPRARTRILASIMLGIFLSILDQTIVATALPRIVGDLKGGDVYTWVTTVYLLTSTISIPFYGKLSDLYGRRPILLAGIAIFVLGSALSAFSQEMWQLVLFRGIQGLGAGALVPIAMAVIGDLYSAADRAKPQSLFGVVFALAVVIGPALGGFLTESVGWHWVFLVNVPFGALAFAVIWRTLPSFRAGHGAIGFDWAGAAVLTAAMAALLVGLANKAHGQWIDPAVGGLVAVGAIGAIVFAIVERRSPSPILSPRLFADPTFSGSMVASFFIAFGFYGAVVFLPLWFQIVAGVSPAQSGLQILPLLLGVVISAIAAGRIVARTGRYKAVLLVSMIVSTVGLVLLSQLSSDTPNSTLTVWMLVAGVGFGPGFSVFTVVVQNAVPVESLGAASASLGFFRQIGGSVGLAVLGTAVSSTFRDAMPAQLASHAVPAEIASHLSRGNVDLSAVTGAGNVGQAILQATPDAARAQVELVLGSIVSAIGQALSIGVGAAFVIGAIAAGIALLGTLSVADIPLRSLSRMSAETPSTSRERILEESAS